MKREFHVKIGITLPQTQVTLGPPGAGKGPGAEAPSTFGEIVALLTPEFQTSGLQNCKGINLVVLSHPAYGTLFRSPGKPIQTRIVTVPVIDLRSVTQLGLHLSDLEAAACGSTS